jgi:TPR repeat protein
MTEEAAPHVAGPVFLRLGRMYLNGLGTERDLKTALICYQKAESFLYDMVKYGNVMYKNSLRAAVEGQAKARALLMAELPNSEWTFDN